MSSLFDEPPPPRDARAPLTVSALVALARGALERGLPAVRVTGEVSNFVRAASGHCYFNLKDAGAQVRCVLWRTKARLVDFSLKDGLAVEIAGAATLYEPRGEFQIAVDSVRPAGAGALYERFARLKARLEAQGWFAPERKRALPAYPRRIGIVTSLAGAALHDVLTTLARRWPAGRVVVYPTSVQGTGAPAEIATAIRVANERAEVDVLIVCRGGGSIEDLWAFNEEVVAAAVYASALPVISGVGHETDMTIIDFVADVRAPTPTGAAMLLVPDRAVLAGRVDGLASRLARSLGHTVATRTQRLDLAARTLQHPAARIAAQRRLVDDAGRRIVAAGGGRVAQDRAALRALAQRLHRELGVPLPGRAQLAQLQADWRRAGAARVSDVGRRLDALAQNLAHLSPAAVLERGYAIVTRGNGDIVTDGASLASGEDVAIAFARGTRGATVK
ncbi:MAG: exodeoxyribonuclease VII large subunit [Proteobacteria bacterium]|nr:exodeoxyribonuclease VII large subunit [Pseudomonadota bacterium]